LSVPVESVAVAVVCVSVSLGVSVVCVPVSDSVSLSQCRCVDNDKLLLFTVTQWPVHYDSVYRWRPCGSAHQILQFLVSVTHKMWCVVVVVVVVVVSK